MAVGTGTGGRSGPGAPPSGLPSPALASGSSAGRPAAAAASRPSRCPRRRPRAPRRDPPTSRESPEEAAGSGRAGVAGIRLDDRAQEGEIRGRDGGVSEGGEGLRGGRLSAAPSGRLARGSGGIRRCLRLEHPDAGSPRLGGPNLWPRVLASAAAAVVPRHRFDNAEADPGGSETRQDGDGASAGAAGGACSREAEADVVRQSWRDASLAAAQVRPGPWRNARDAILARMPGSAPRCTAFVCVTVRYGAFRYADFVCPSCPPPVFSRNFRGGDRGRGGVKQLSRWLGQGLSCLLWRDNRGGLGPRGSSCPPPAPRTCLKSTRHHCLEELPKFPDPPSPVPQRRSGFAHPRVQLSVDHEARRPVKAHRTPSRERSSDGARASGSEGVAWPGAFGANRSVTSPQRLPPPARAIRAGGSSHREPLHSMPGARFGRDVMPLVQRLKITAFKDRQMQQSRGSGATVWARSGPLLQELLMLAERADAETLERLVASQVSRAAPMPCPSQ